MTKVRSTQRKPRTIAHRADIVVITYFTLADGTRVLMRSIVNPTDIHPVCHYRGVIRGKAY